jgi:hypothetical protein
MRPTCYLLESSAESASLYLGETSTEERLETFALATPVEITEFGARSGDQGWVEGSRLPAIGSVEELLESLRVRPHLELVDVSAIVGEVKVSTHDEGEVQLTFPCEMQALAFLRTALGSGAEDVISCLLQNKGRYVAERRGSLHVFETFESYLATSA